MSTEITTKPRSDLRTMIASPDFQSKIALALPSVCTPERFIRLALNAVGRNPQLLACTPMSVLQCLLDLSAFGIEADGRRAHLIPFRDNRSGTMICTLILDYKGIAELVRRSGDVSNIHADVVHQNDDFSFAYGSEAHLRHKPCLGERGEIIGAYSYVRLKDGSEDFTVMSKGEVDAVRKRSRSGGAGPWVSDFAAMAAKTVFRRHSKWLPLSVNVRDALALDEEPTPTAVPVARTADLPAVPVDMFIPDAMPDPLPPVEVDEIDMTPVPAKAAELEKPKRKVVAKPMPDPLPTTLPAGVADLVMFCGKHGITFDAAMARFASLRITVAAKSWGDFPVKLAADIMADPAAVFEIGTEGGEQ